MPRRTQTTITLAGPNDIEAVAALLAALDLHYQGRTIEPEDRVERAARYLREAANGIHYAIARTNGSPVGIACFALFRHGLVHTGSLFLKDLFVIEAARGSGAGETLMHFIAHFAREHEVERIDLSVDIPNIEAARFYRRLGGEPVESKRFYRFIGEAVARLANRD